MSKRIKDAVASVAVSVAVVLALTAIPLWASQNNLFNPTTGTLSGLTMVQGFNNALDSVNTCNSGGSAPSNQLSGTPSAGNCWYNTATGAVQFYDGAQWLTVGTIDATNHVFTPVVGGGAAASVASAATTNLCGASGTAPTQSFLSITGSATIGSFGSNCTIGQVKILSFAAALTLTYNSAALILPTAANITTAAGDVAVAIYLGGGNWQIAIFQRATGAPLSTAGLNISAAALSASALGSFEQPVNLQINATAASNQMTVAIKGINGADPSPGNPVLVGFRDATSTGTQVSGSLQMALSFTLASTSSMGCTTGVACRLWVELICQTISSGSCTSILVGLSLQSTSTACYSLNEAALQSTGPGTGGGTSANTIQTSVASLTNKPIRIIGYIEATWASGTGWGSPSNIQIFGPGVRKPCERVQYAFTSTSTSGRTSSLTFANLSSAMSLSILPTSVLNPVRIVISGTGTQGTGQGTLQTLRASTLIGQPQVINASASPVVTYLETLDAPSTSSAVTYSYQGKVTGNVMTFPASGWGAQMWVEEIMGSLDPKNDSDTPLRMVG